MVTSDFSKHVFPRLFSESHFWTFLEMSKNHFPFYFWEKSREKIVAE
jgi:hypothetical protein